MTSIIILAIIILIIGFSLSLFLTGVNRAVSSLPVLIIVSLILAVLFKISFYFLLIFLPILFILRLINGGNYTYYKKTKYYRTNSDEDFEEYYQRTSRNRNQNGQNGHTGYVYGKARYCRILNVSETATKEEVKKAYRDLVKLHHPDKYMTASKEEQQYHENEIKKINEAYEKLMKYYQ